MIEGRRARLVRLGALIAVVIVLLVVGAATGVRSRFTVENVRATAVAWGAWGVLAFAAAYCLGALIYLPGMVFLVAAVLAWGRVAGGGIAFCGAVLAVTVTFVLVRAAGGRVIAESPRPWVRRVMAGLDAHPIRAIFVLRLVLLSSPPVNYALALTSVRFRDHLIGSALGLALPVLGVALFTEWALRLLA